MDTAAIIAKIVGTVLFLFTARSIYKHFKRNKAAKREQAAAAKPAGSVKEQSKIENILNTVLLYAWFVFMTAFSLGMFFNN